MSITNTQLAQQITDLVAKWGLREDEMVNWLSGVVAGGPSADGKYPLTNLLGETKYVTCPAQLEQDVLGLVNSAFAYSSAAETSATAAATSAASAASSEAAAAASEANALAYKDASLAAAQDSQAARDKAQLWAEQFENAEVEPGKYSALHYAAKAAASEANAGTSEDMAAAWAENPVDTAVVVGKYSALHHATKAAQSASQAASSATAASTSASAAAASAAQAETVVAGAVQADGSVPMTGDLRVPSINGGPLAGFRNLIINGGMDISQRGTSFTSVGYTLDRWKVYRSGTGGFSVSQVATRAFGGQYAFSISGEFATGEYVDVIQYIESHNCQHLVGKKVTLSFYHDEALSTSDVLEVILVRADSRDVYTTHTSFFTAQVPLKPTAGKSVVTTDVVCPSEVANGMAVFFRLTRGGSTGAMSFRLGGVQLEEGVVATPFERRPIGVELELCMRYYEHSYPPGTPIGELTYSGSIVGTSGDSGTQIQFNVFYTTPKRTTPTVTLWPIDISATPGYATCEPTRTNIAVNVNTNHPKGLRAYVGATTGKYQGYIHYTAHAEI